MAKNRGSKKLRLRLKPIELDARLLYEGEILQDMGNQDIRGAPGDVVVDIPGLRDYVLPLAKLEQLAEILDGADGLAAPEPDPEPEPLRLDEVLEEIVVDCTEEEFDKLAEDFERALLEE